MDGVKEGLWEVYWENGQLREKGSYKEGKEHGILEYYYENGQLDSKGSYKDGELDGLLEFYYENGQLASKGSYKGGNRNGPHEYYHENGELKSKGSFRRGKKAVLGCFFVPTVRLNQRRPSRKVNCCPGNLNPSRSLFERIRRRPKPNPPRVSVQSYPWF